MAGLPGPMMFLWLLACPSSDPATLTIVTPEDGATVCGDPLEVVMDVENFELVDPFATPDAPHSGTEGHIDLFLNGQSIDMIGGSEVSIPGVTDGEYRLSANLANADHTAVDPFAGDFVFITVDSSVCE
jgi:hypothetical protein